jgi:hypothetical protein
MAFLAGARYGSGCVLERGPSARAMILSRYFGPRIRLSGYMIVRDVVRQGYPYLEAIRSVLPSCDEFLVQDGFSTDETWTGLQLLRDRYPGKMRLFREKWAGSTSGGQMLAEMSNRLRRKCRGSYCLNLQANEVVPAAAAAELARLPELHPQVDLFKLPFLTFMGPRLAWMLQYRTRLFRNDPDLVSLGDAYDVGMATTKKRRRSRSYCWKQVAVGEPIRRYRGLFPVNFLRKVEGRLELFQAEHARYFTVKELAYGRKILAALRPGSDSPSLFWEQMRVYIEELMWQDNENGLRPEEDTVRPMLGFLPEPFLPLVHLSDQWEYDFAESCRAIRQD